MIEIATCMNDLAEGAVWQAKEKRSRAVRISSVWKQGETTCVGFRIWDTQGTAEEREAWEVGQVLSREDFEAEYVYAEHHHLNNERQSAKNDYLISRLLSDISDCFEVESRREGRELVKKLQTLTKRQAGYQILAHEWDEGCVGSGCCADTADMGGDLLVDENSLTDEEIKDLTA